MARAPFEHGWSNDLHLFADSDGRAPPYRAAAGSALVGLGDGISRLQGEWTIAQDMRITSPGT